MEVGSGAKEFRFSKSAREPFQIPRSFNPPQHRTLDQPANLYQLSQVNDLPPRVGVGSDEGDGDANDSDDDDDFLANEAKAWFEADMQGEEKDRWGYGTGGVFVLPQDHGDETSPFKATGELKKSRHATTQEEGDGADLVRDLPHSDEDSEEEEGEDEVLAVTSSVIPPPAKPPPQVPAKPPPQVPALRMSPRKAKVVKREEERTRKEEKVGHTQLSARSDPGLTSEKIMKLAEVYHIDLVGSQTARATVGAGTGTPATVASTDQGEEDGQEGEEEEVEELSERNDRVEAKVAITDAISFDTTRSQIDLLAAAAKPLPFSPIRARVKKEDKPYNNYLSRFVPLQQEQKSKDWYVANDGSPYVSKFHERLKQERGDPDKLMCGGKRGFRLEHGKWEVHSHFGVRNSGPYLGHHEEHALVHHRGPEASRQHRHKWVADKGWTVIGCRKQPHHRRLV
eukprot:CAMPEP_0182477258 /NCGR_PEP_ID=MMETSP1319-20130603/30578_1 /TAXON_ID=172717 /ORGANISM="Bolidomonas pacifica, Strain RCC208" /LENGTH=453 /DNA_ID=CAMNT_0024678449 /DNA_START=116 /DNA_END=1474 /DNA_ORIENTATION=+